MAESIFTWCSLSTRVTSERSPGAIESLNLDVNEENTALGVSPLNFNHALWVLHKAANVGAIFAVNANPSATGNKPDDRVSRNRGATPGEFDQNIVSPAD